MKEGSVMPLLKHYHDAIKEGSIQQDPAQLEGLKVLQDVWNGLLKPREKAPARGLFSVFSNRRNVVEPVCGAYLWGGVGRGKTWLMDMFYSRIPLAEKRRMHYHHFMFFIHEELKKLSMLRNPLEALAEKLAQDVRLLCIDEFHVMDIVDAMMLHGVLDAMFKNGITLVTTSNRVPGDLYLNGLQRERFLPAIALLKKHTHVVELDNHIDYRMLKKISGDSFLEDDDAILVEHELEKCFAELAIGEIHIGQDIEVQGRILPTHRVADNSVWFDFKTLCETARSTRDYIELAERFDYIVLSGLHVLTEDHEAAARRFLNLIDELYDRQVQFIFSTTISLENLYQGQKLHFEFQRALSRLNEMQGDDYQQVRLAEAV
ncbi:MAG: cell division protein ZapE [Thiothrix sp.]|jgi:cell division protein ZapE|uniref:cell division protein ZapE n=1 Tax=Thiothrix sp. TaxID=1032 RepID=UPI0026360638|nr:cell division protein ZapE [Thiothrix sp.]MDD5394257.1 cell division protein ZapE [Thiothrix sp.]